MVKVLLVDDDPHYLEIIRRALLRNFRFAIKSVGTEEQALEELARDDFDLVLLDLYIDGQRSWETLKRVVAHPGRPVAIVFSCEDTRGNADHAVSLGAHTFLGKPFNFARLKNTIDAALRMRYRDAKAPASSE